MNNKNTSLQELTRTLNSPLAAGGNERRSLRSGQTVEMLVLEREHRRGQLRNFARALWMHHPLQLNAPRTQSQVLSHSLRQVRG